MLRVVRIKLKIPGKINAWLNRRIDKASQNKTASPRIRGERSTPLFSTAGFFSHFPPFFSHLSLAFSFFTLTHTLA